MTEPIDPKHLRVSDAERSHVLVLLERATGQGLIDLHEYNERSAAVISARTRADLNSVLLDLPGLQIAGRTVDEAEAATLGPPPPVPGFSGAPAAARGGPDVLDLAGWGSRSFKGTWVVPSRIVISGTGASTKLDFTAAQLTSRTVTIEFQSNYGGSADLIVPPGTSVQLDGLQMRGGQLNNKVLPGTGQRGAAAGADRDEAVRIGDRPHSAAGAVRALNSCSFGLVVSVRGGTRADRPAAGGRRHRRCTGPARPAARRPRPGPAAGQARRRRTTRRAH